MHQANLSEVNFSVTRLLSGKTIDPLLGEVIDTNGIVPYFSFVNKYLASGFVRNSFILEHSFIARIR